jgi:hypothetical protein
LTDEEAEVARTIFYRRVFTQNMWAEWRSLEANSERVSAQATPEAPYYAFISSQNEEDWWRESITAYVEKIGGAYSILDGGHYIHLDYPERIAEKVREIIES